MNTYLETPPVFQNNSLLKYGLLKSVVIFTLFFIGMMLVASSIVGTLTLVVPSNSITFLYLSIVVQAIVGFIGTAVLASAFLSQKPLKLLCLKKAPSLRPIAGIIIAYIIAIPAMNQIIYWNANTKLPESMSHIEEILRQLEEANGAVSEMMLSGTSVFTLLLGIVVIGVLTGISEEMLFRGALQRIIGEKSSKIVAIWISAFIFSAIHFQFFGFIPRMLLGAWFGYILLWTGSTWNCAFAHALNNSMVVIITWITNRGIDLENLDSWGVATTGFPWLPAGSLLMFAGFIILGRNFFFLNGKN